MFLATAYSAYMTRERKGRGREKERCQHEKTGRKRSNRREGRRKEGVGKGETERTLMIDEVAAPIETLLTRVTNL